jgi:hypothetical protein
MATNGRRKRRYLTGPQQSRIEELAGPKYGYTPAQIHRELSKKGGDVPVLRTIQRYVEHLRPADPSEAWELGADLTDFGVVLDRTDTKLLLDVLAAAHRETEGRIERLTRGEAAWVVHVGRGDLGLASWDVYQVALRFRALELGGFQRDVLTLNLALGGADREATQRVLESLVRQSRRRRTGGKAR